MKVDSQPLTPEREHPNEEKTTVAQEQEAATESRGSIAVVPEEGQVFRLLEEDGQSGDDLMWEFCSLANACANCGKPILLNSKCCEPGHVEVFVAPRGSDLRSCFRGLLSPEVIGAMKKRKSIPLSDCYKDAEAVNAWHQMMLWDAEEVVEPVSTASECPECGRHSEGGSLCPDCEPDYVEEWTLPEIGSCYVNSVTVETDPVDRVLRATITFWSHPENDPVAEMLKLDWDWNIVSFAHLDVPAKRLVEFYSSRYAEDFAEWYSSLPFSTRQEELLEFFDDPEELLHSTVHEPELMILDYYAMNRYSLRDNACFSIPWPFNWEPPHLHAEIPLTKPVLCTPSTEDLRPEKYKIRDLVWEPDVQEIPLFVESTDQSFFGGIKEWFNSFFIDRMITAKVSMEIVRQVLPSPAFSLNNREEDSGAIEDAVYRVARHINIDRTRELKDCVMSNTISFLLSVWRFRKRSDPMRQTGLLTQGN